jgi:predicted dehydrogenase
MTSLRFAIIGAGAISQGYAQAFQSCDDAEVVAVSDIRLPAAKSLAEVLGCSAFDSHEKVTEECEIDAVLVCTPPSNHAAICLHFIERGIHVLCEKPFTIGSKDADTVVEAARDHGVTVTMASKFRYVEDVIKAKQIVDSGVLGDIVLFENTFTSRVDMTKRWNSNAEISGGGVLIDNGTHSVDIARYFLGPLVKVHVMQGRRGQEVEVEDTVQIFVRAATGVMGTIDLSWSINKEVERYISVYGSHGTVIVGWKESKYRQLGSSDWVVFGTGYDKISAFENQIRNFSRSIQGREMLLIGADDALASVEVIEAAYASMNENHWTPVTHKGNATV